VLPLCGCIIGVLLAQLLLWIDRTVHIKTLMHYSSGTATGVLAAIIGAMVALLGFVVTIGVLGIQQATATLSPRFMRLWYRDRLQKVVLLTFAGTFTYSFALLSRIDTNFVPDLGVTIAGIAVALSLILLLVYLNRFTHALRPVAVAALVEQAGERVLRSVAADPGPTEGEFRSHCQRIRRHRRRTGALRAGRYRGRRH